MIVVKRKRDDMYLGKYTDGDGYRSATEDIKKARMYKSIKTAKSALATMGYDPENEKYEYIEVSKSEKIYKPKELQESMLQMDLEQ